VENRKKALILVVDDNAGNLQILGNMLTNEGYLVASATGGAKVVEFSLKRVPDLILLDIMMPEIDGFEVCRQLKSNKNTKSIPVIFLTAKIETEDIVTAFNAGAVDYIKKPFNSDELLARVKTHIDLKRAYEEIKRLQGIIPVCSSCNKIRDDKNEWLTMVDYMNSHTEAELSHTLCPTCIVELYPEFADKLNKG